MRRHKTRWRWDGKRYAAVLALVLGSWLGMARTARADQVRLSTGEVLIVRIVEVNDHAVVLIHPLLGRLVLPRSEVTILSNSAPEVPAPGIPATSPTTAAAGPTANTMPASAPATQSAATQAGMFWTVAPPAPAKPLLIPGWAGYIDIGGSGASGNSEAQNLRLAGGLKRTDNDDEVDTALDASYAYASSFGVESKDRAEFNARRDWSFRPSEWGYFLLGRVEYDQFQPWTWRLSAEGGPSYAFIRDRAMLLRGRVGAGVSDELLGGDPALDPEGVVGVDLKYKIDPRQGLFGVVDYLPSMIDAPEYRLNSKAGWEIAVDKSGRIRLKVGVEDLYDSSPSDGPHRDDVTYFITLGWTF